MDLKLFNNSFFRFYKIFFYHSIIDMELKYIDKNLIDKKHLSKAREIANSMHAFKLNVKRALPEYNEVFQDCSNEKIFAIMTMVNKMLLMTESECLEFEKSLEIEEIN